MTLFKNKKRVFPAPIYYNLDSELIRARRKKEYAFYYPLKEDEVSKAMAWGIRNRVGIELDHVTDNINYYKFYGYSL